MLWNFVLWALIDVLLLLMLMLMLLFLLLLQLLAGVIVDSSCRSIG